MGDRESRVLDQNFEVEFELGRENVAILQLPSCFVHRVLSADVCSQPRSAVRDILYARGLVNRSEATVKIGFVDTVNRLTALVINLETNTV